MAATDVSVERLRSSFEYDRETGALVRVVDQFGRPMRAHVGAVTRRGYGSVCFMGVPHKVHRLVWALHYGSWPTDHVDHIDGNRSNNALANLRLADRSINQQNQRRARSDNKLGLLGVSTKKATGKFVAQIGISGRKVNLGTFSTAEEAHAAYVEAKRRLHQGCTL